MLPIFSRSRVAIPWINVPEGGRYSAQHNFVAVASLTNHLGALEMSQFLPSVFSGDRFAASYASPGKARS